MTDELLKKDKPQAIKLGNKEYELSPLNLNVMTAIEEEFNCNFSDFGKVLAETKQVTSLRKLIFVLLRENYPDLTIEKVGGLITPDNLAGIDEAIGNALFGEKYAEMKAGVEKSTEEQKPQ